MEDHGLERRPAKPGQERRGLEEAMIAICDLAFQFPHSDFRLSVPSLQIGRVERVAIIGPSGSGKTTLLHLISGILSPSQGVVREQVHHVVDYRSTHGDVR